MEIRILKKIIMSTILIGLFLMNNLYGDRTAYYYTSVYSSGRKVFYIQLLCPIGRAFKGYAMKKGSTAFLVAVRRWEGVFRFRAEEYGFRIRIKDSGNWATLDGEDIEYKSDKWYELGPHKRIEWGWGDWYKLKFRLDDKLRDSWSGWASLTKAQKGFFKSSELLDEGYYVTFRIVTVNRPIKWQDIGKVEFCDLVIGMRATPNLGFFDRASRRGATYVHDSYDYTEKWKIVRMALEKWYGVKDKKQVEEALNNLKKLCE